MSRPNQPEWFPRRQFALIVGEGGARGPMSPEVLISRLLYTPGEEPLKGRPASRRNHGCGRRLRRSSGW